jgi:hypothetical protein
VSQHGWNYGLGAKPPQPKPRAATVAKDSRQGRIDIYGITPKPAEVAENESDSIRIPASFLFGYEGAASTPKLVFPEGLANKAEVYAISADGRDINARQPESGFPQKLRFGLESLSEEEVTLQFRLSGVVESALLFDKAANRQIPIVDGSRYRFTHRFERKEGEFKGMDSERFELEPTYRSGEGTGGENAYLWVSADRQELKVQAGQLIEAVEMTTASGSVLFKSAGIHSAGYRKGLSVPSGVYMVRVSLESGKTEARKLIVK